MRNELSIDEALKLGIEAHKAGQVQDAERLYTAILEAQPKHPDANHNMGVLAVDVHKVQEALPFFKTALEVSPNTAQFSLSCIEALIKLDRLADAEAVLDQAKSNGAKDDRFDQLKQRLNATNKVPKKSMAQGHTMNQGHPNILDTHTLDQAIKLAKKKFKKGLSEEAQRIYQNILIKYPKNKRAVDGFKAISGMAFSKTSKIQDPPQDRLQLLIDVYQQGQFQNALGVASQLLKQFPKSAILYNIQGAINEELGSLNAAMVSYKKAVVINPGFAQAYNNMSIILKKQDKLDEAIEACNKALAIVPRYAGAYNNRGSVLEKQGKLEKAMEAYNMALAIEPGYADAHNNRGIVLKKQGKLERAIAAYKRALAVKPDYAEAYYNLGISLQDQDQLDEAVEAYKKALAVKPDYAMAYNNMGTAFMESGNFEGAIGAFNKSLTIKPDDTRTHRNLSQIKTYTSEDNQFLKVQNLFSNETLSKSDRCNLSFTLAKMHEDLGEFDKAFEYLTEGNSLRKKFLNYTIEQDEALFLSLKKSQSNLIKNKFKPEINSDGIIPVFIVGMPRSGTSLVEQIISSHSEVRPAGELGYVSQFGMELALGSLGPSQDNILNFRKSYLKELKKRAYGQRIVTDKMPQNFRFIALLCCAFPEAKVIHVQRDPAATCWSNYRHYFTAHDLGYCFDLKDVVSYFNLYRDLMQFWRLYFSDNIYNINYEKLTTNQDTETINLIKHLELDWENACLFPQDNKNSVKSASQLQVRKKIYQGSSQAWRRYEPFLNGIFDQQ